MDLNRLTAANILAHAKVNAAVEDIAILYGTKGVALAESLVAKGLLVKGSRNGFPTYNLTATGRATYYA